VAVDQTAPPTHPTLRPHRLGIGLYDLADGVAPRRLAVEADIAPAATTPVPALAGVPAADLLLINDGDLTYAKVRLDPRSVGSLPRMLPALPDPLARAVLWGYVLDSVRDAERPVRELVELAVTVLPAETRAFMVEDVLTLTRALVDAYAVPADRAGLLARLADGCALLLSTAEPGGSRQLAAARTLVDSMAAEDARLAGWLVGAGAPHGLAGDADLRWRIRYRQVVLGAAGEDEIAAELAVDRSASGAEWAARCRAALPDPAAKERAWRLLIEDVRASNRLVEETSRGFWQPEQAELTDAYVARYFAGMPAAARRRTAWVAERLAALAFPYVAVRQATREAAARLLARPDLEPGLRRAVTDADDEVRRALLARACR
jgi:aminopeptidase N